MNHIFPWHRALICFGDEDSTSCDRIKYPGLVPIVRPYPCLVEPVAAPSWSRGSSLSGKRVSRPPLYRPRRSDLCLLSRLLADRDDRVSLANWGKIDVVVKSYLCREAYSLGLSSFPPLCCPHRLDFALASLVRHDQGRDAAATDALPREARSLGVSTLPPVCPPHRMSFAPVSVLRIDQSHRDLLAFGGNIDVRAACASHREAWLLGRSG